MTMTAPHAVARRSQAYRERRESSHMRQFIAKFHFSHADSRNAISGEMIRRL